MKVQTCRFTERQNVLGANIERYDARTSNAKDVQVTATERGIQFQRERVHGDEVVIERSMIPWSQVRDWTPPVERRPLKQDGARK